MRDCEMRLASHYPRVASWCGWLATPHRGSSLLTTTNIYVGATW